MNDPDLLNAFSAYLSGKTLNECAGIAGICVPTFRKRLKAGGLTLRREHVKVINATPAVGEAIAAYRGGTSIEKCAKMCGLGRETMRQRVIKAGIPLRGRDEAATRRRIPTPPGLIDDYLGGMSVKATAAKYSLQRSSVLRMLEEAGLNGRDRSEAMRLRWQRASTGERDAMLDNAHQASRGRRVSDSERQDIASAKAGITFSESETTLGAFMSGLGYDVTYGVPCGAYNIDIVVAGTVAVEIFGGQWHEVGLHRARFEKRTRHIFDAGYSLVIVWAEKRRFPISARCAQHLGTLVEITRGGPSIGRQHWVIRGDGQFLAVREDDGNEIPFITSSGRCDRLGA